MISRLDLEPADPIALEIALREAKRQNDIYRYLELCTEPIFSEQFGAALLYALKFAKPKEHPLMKPDHPYDLKVGAEIQAHQKDGSVVTFIVTSIENGGRVKAKSDKGDRDLAYTIGNLCRLYSDQQVQPPPIKKLTESGYSGNQTIEWIPDPHHALMIYLETLKIILGERHWFFWLWSQTHGNYVEYDESFFMIVIGDHHLYSSGRVNCRNGTTSSPDLPELNRAEIEEFVEWADDRTVIWM